MRDRDSDWDRDRDTDAEVSRSPDPPVPPSSGLIARRLVVEGRVQGVGFRWFVLSRAQGMGVRGWVRNLPDGAVEVVGLAAGGTMAELEALVRRGPPGAVVKRVEVSDVPHDHVESKSFIIKH